MATCLGRALPLFDLRGHHCSLLGERGGRKNESPPVRGYSHRIVWHGKFELTLIGPREERWDLCFIAEYPAVSAFIEMIHDPIYREAVKHRQAAVEDSRLIRLAPLAPGQGFGELSR